MRKFLGLAFVIAVAYTAGFSTCLWVIERHLSQPAAAAAASVPRITACVVESASKGAAR